jgi:hypothetical protein
MAIMKGAMSLFSPVFSWTDTKLPNYILSSLTTTTEFSATPTSIGASVAIAPKISVLPTSSSSADTVALIGPVSTVVGVVTTVIIMAIRLWCTSKRFREFDRRHCLMRWLLYLCIVERRRQIDTPDDESQESPLSIIETERKV